MNNMVWDAVLWLRKKLNRDKEDIIGAVNNIQNLFATSADATASASDILEGQTAYNGTVLITGNMKDRRGTTVTAAAVTQDENYTYLSIPEEACYDSNSKVRTENSNIFDDIYNAIKAQGTTPASKSPDDLVSAIGTLATTKYNAGAETRGSSVQLQVQNTGSTGNKRIKLLLYKNGRWNSLYENETAEGVLVTYNT